MLVRSTTPKTVLEVQNPPSETHSFDVSEAKAYGLAAAVILANFRHWIGYHQANGTHHHAGRTWVYYSRRALTVLFPYLTEKEIRNALNRLRLLGVIRTGNYNRSPLDKTLWYAFTDQYIKATSPTRTVCLENTRLAPRGQPIPIINKDLDIPKSLKPKGFKSLGAARRVVGELPEKKWPPKTRASKKPESVVSFREIVHRWPNAVQQEAIGAKVTDQAKWQEVVKAWMGQGFRPTNVTGMLAWYDSEIPAYAKNGQLGLAPKSQATFDHLFQAVAECRGGVRPNQQEVRTLSQAADRLVDEWNRGARLLDAYHEILAEFTRDYCRWVVDEHAGRLASVRQLGPGTRDWDNFSRSRGLREAVRDARLSDKGQ